MKYYTPNNEPEKTFTTKEKNAIIKEKVKSAFPTMPSALTTSSDTIAKIKNKGSSEKKNTLRTQKPAALQSNPSTTQQKPSTLLFTPDLQGEAKFVKLPYIISQNKKEEVVKLPYIIPREKKERERLERITGAYNLNKVKKLSRCVSIRTPPKALKSGFFIVVDFNIPSYY